MTFFHLLVLDATTTESSSIESLNVYGKRYSAMELLLVALYIRGQPLIKV